MGADLDACFGGGLPRMSTGTID